MGTAYTILVKKPERKRQLRSPRQKLKVDNKTGLEEIECGAMDWIHLA
jgi:hypothetical protein